jgi:hypothetical protein
MPRRKRKQDKVIKWRPTRDGLAFYAGDTGGRVVRVLAEARGGRTYVEGCNGDGAPVRFCVKTTRLGRVAPGLFETAGETGPV